MVRLVLPDFIGVLPLFGSSLSRTGLSAALKVVEATWSPGSGQPPVATMPTRLACLGLKPTSLQFEALERDIELGRKSGVLGFLQEKCNH